MARKVYANSVTPIPVQEGVAPQGFIVHAAESVNKQQEMTVLFSLSIPAAAETDLEAKVAGGQVLSPDQQKNYEANAGVYAKATAAQIEQSLAVNMVNVTKDGLTYVSARNAPSLPEEVGSSVRAILGLQPFRRAHKHARIFLLRHPARHAARARTAAARAVSGRIARLRSARATGKLCTAISCQRHPEGLQRG